MVFQPPSQGSRLNAVQRRMGVTPVARPQGGNNKPNGPKGPGKKNKGPGVPTVDQYIAGDDTYKGIISQTEANFAGAQSVNNWNQGNINQDFNTTLARLGEQEGKDKKNLVADYAARGLLGSGLEWQADTDLVNNYNKLEADAALSKDRNIQQLLFDIQDAGALKTQTQDNAKLDAIRRRTAEYGITGGPATVDNNGKGKGNKDGKGKGKGKN